MSNGLVMLYTLSFPNEINRWSATNSMYCRMSLAFILIKAAGNASKNNQHIVFSNILPAKNPCSILMAPAIICRMTSGWGHHLRWLKRKHVKSVWIPSSRLISSFESVRLGIRASSFRIWKWRNWQTKCPPLWQKQPSARRKLNVGPKSIWEPYQLCAQRKGWCPSNPEGHFLVHLSFLMAHKFTLMRDTGGTLTSWYWTGKRMNWCLDSFKGSSSPTQKMNDKYITCGRVLTFGKIYFTNEFCMKHLELVLLWVGVIN